MILAAYVGGKGTLWDITKEDEASVWHFTQN